MMEMEIRRLRMDMHSSPGLSEMYAPRASADALFTESTLFKRMYSS
jgi:hypothetical protein